jgi:predicted transcriptional regulator
MNYAKNIVRVRDVMNANFLVVDGLETVADTVRKMKASDADCVIVDRRNENDEYGLVVAADIAKQVLAQDRAPERVNVYEIMSKPVISLPPDMDIRYAARLFERFGLNVAPVMNATEKVHGMVTYHNIVMRGLLRD